MVQLATDISQQNFKMHVQDNKQTVIPNGEPFAHAPPTCELHYSSSYYIARYVCMHEQSTNHTSLIKQAQMLVTHYIGHISANTRPHHLCLGNWVLLPHKQNAGIGQPFCSSKTC